MSNLLKQIHTVNKHRFLVFIHCFKCGIPFRGLVHDLSKYEPCELFPSAKYYNGSYSPIVNERFDNHLFSNVFLHHTNHNKHHYEYWIDQYRGDLIIRKMPYKYSIEYVCDMISASKTYLKKNFNQAEPLKFFNRFVDGYFMHSMTKEFITILLTRYKESGFKGLKKKDTKRIYNELNSRYQYNELIECYSLNNGFKIKQINDEYVQEVFKKR